MEQIFYRRQLGLPLVISYRYAKLAILAGCSVLALASCSLVGRNPASLPVQYYTTEPQRAPIYFSDPLGDTIRGDADSLARGENSRANSHGENTARVEPVKTQTYDVVVVGGELAGWAASYELARHHLHVLELESSDQTATNPSQTIAIADGEAVIDRPPTMSGGQEVSEVFRKFFRAPETQVAEAGREPGAIDSPIIDNLDAYYYDGVFYNHLWSHSTLKKLPPAFALFKQELKEEFKDRMIGNIPLETSTFRHYHLDLDQMNGVQWIQQMPENIRARSDSKSQAIYKRFHNENFVSNKTIDSGMKSVLKYANLVCLTRAGTKCANLSALFVAKLMLDSTHLVHPLANVAEGVHRLHRDLIRNPYMSFKTDVHLTSIMNANKKSVEVDYTRHGVPYQANARAVIWAMNLRSAPSKIEGFTANKHYSIRKQAKLMDALTYAPVMRYNIVLNGRPFYSSYQTWWQSSKTPSAGPTPTSFLLPHFFDEDSTSDIENVTLVEPLPINMAPDLNGQSKLDAKTAASLASHAVATWARTFQSLFYSLNSKSSQNLKSGAIQLQSVHISRMPASVLIVGPGHFIDDARFLRRPFGHVYFASPDIGIPTFEEAVFRAHCAARSALLQLRPQDFKTTTSSRCPSP